MVECAPLPICRGLTLVGATVFEQAALFDTVVAPYQRTALIYRMKRIDNNSRPREIQSRSHRTLAELLQNFCFRHSAKPNLDQPRCGLGNVAVVHVLCPLGALTQLAQLDPSLTVVSEKGRLLNGLRTRG